MSASERPLCSVCERPLTDKEIEGCRKYGIKPPICATDLANKIARAREDKRQAEKRAAREFAATVKDQKPPKNPDTYTHDLDLATVSRLLGMKQGTTRFREIFVLGLLPYKRDPVTGKVTVSPVDLAGFMKRVQADDPQIPELIRIVVQLGMSRKKSN